MLGPVGPAVRVWQEAELRLLEGNLPVIYRCLIMAEIPEWLF